MVGIDWKLAAGIRSRKAKTQLSIVAMLVVIIAAMAAFVAAQTSLNVQYSLITEPIAGVAYTPECLVECHLPLRVTFGDAYAVDKTSDFSPKLVMGAGNYDFDTLEFRRLVTMTEERTRWVSDWQCSPWDEESLNGTVTHDGCDDKGYTEKYSAEWQEWQPFSPTDFTFKADTEYVIDLVGKRKAGIGDSAVDAQFCFGSKCTIEYAWWNSNWQYRRPITIANNVAVDMKTDFTLNVTVDTSAWNMKADGTDIRFIYDETTDLDWINTTAPNATRATFWLKLQGDIPASLTNDTHYEMYYGNDAAGSPSQTISNIFSHAVNTSTDDYGECILIAPLNEGSGTSTTDLCEGTSPSNAKAEWDSSDTHPIGAHDSFSLGGSGMQKTASDDDTYYYNFGKTTKSNEIGVKDFFISYWAKLHDDDADPSIGYFYMHTSDCSGNSGFSLGRGGEDDLLYWLETSPPPPGYSMVRNASATEGSWHNVVYTRDDSAETLKMYIDGVFMQDAGSAGDFTTDRDMILGLGPCSGKGFYGIIDDFMMVEGVPTQKMVDDLYMGRMYHVATEPTVTLGAAKTNILNPDITTPTDLQPSPAYTTDTITTSTNYTESFQGDAGTVYGKWYVDDVNVYSKTVSDVANGTKLDFSLAQDNFTKHQLVNFSVYAESGDNTSDTKWSNTIEIQNTAPVVDLSPLDNMPLSEDTFNDTILLSDYVSDADTEDPDSAINWSCSTNETDVTASADNSTKYLTLTAMNDFYGSASVTCTADDEDGGTGSDSFSVSVTPMNDAPLWTTDIPNASITEDDLITEHDADLTAAPGGLCSDVDNINIELSFNVTAENVAEVDCTVNGTQLLIEPAADWYGTASCTIQCSDGELTADSGFSIDVAEVNDLPTHDTPLLYSALGTNFTTENLTCTAQNVVDLDGDLVQNITAWYVDSSPLEALIMPFEGGSNSTHTKDYSPADNTGTVIGPAWGAASGVLGGGYVFDGIDDYINADATVDDFNGTHGTMMAWFKFSDGSEWSDGESNVIVQMKTDLSSQVVVLNKYLDDTLQFRYRAGGVNLDVFLDVSSRTDTDWTFVAITWDSGADEVKAYFNGAQVGATVTELGTWTAETGKGRIGSRTLNDLNFNGSIDEVRIFNRALSAEQILQMNSTVTNIMVSEETTPGETYQCELTPNDGEADGETKQSNELEVRWSITFNVSSSEIGHVDIDEVDISCDYTGFDQDPYTTNMYGPYGFAPGNWECTFTRTGFYYPKTVDFTADSDKRIDVVMNEMKSLTDQEHFWLEETHTWSEWLYDCFQDGSCKDLLENINQTTTNTWNQFKQTDEDVVELEDTLNKVVNSTHDLTIDYRIDVPTKEDYQFLPMRLYYWFLSEDNTTCYDQSGDTRSAETPSCHPFVAETVGKVNTLHNFTVELRPDVPASGVYTVVRRIEIDPPENGMPVWINYGHEGIGMIEVTEVGEGGSVTLHEVDYIEKTELPEPTEEQQDGSMSDVTGMVTGSDEGSLATSGLLAGTFLIALVVVCLTVYGVKRKEEQ